MAQHLPDPHERDPAPRPSRRPPCGAAGASRPRRSLRAGTPGAPSRRPSRTRSARTELWRAGTPPAGRSPAALAADMRRSPRRHRPAAAADPSRHPCRAPQARPRASRCHPAQPCDLAAAQPEPQQHEDQRVVAPPERRPAITASQQRLGIRAWLIPRGSDERRRPVTGSAACDRSAATSPSTKQNRRNARSPDTKYCAARPTPPSRHAQHGARSRRAPTRRQARRRTPAPPRNQRACAT